MSLNMGALDRGLRGFVVAPVALAVAILVGAGTVAGIVLFVIGAIMLATSVTGYCPTYTLVGISTHHGLHRVGHDIRAHHV